MNFKISKYTFGSDFELAVKEINGNIIPALMVPGTKDNPVSIGNNCFCQRDGVNFEANIPPVNTKKDWLKYTDYCFKEGNRLLALQGLTLHPSSSHVYSPEQLDQGDLRKLFCTESNDAYQNGKIRNVKVSKKTNMRTCGYHFHIGFNRKCPESGKFPDMATKCLLAFYCDLHMGVVSVLLDTDNQRRNMYGKPGDFRFKSIGTPCNRLNLFEYRSLGGNLLKDKRNISWVFNAGKNVIKSFNARSPLPDLKIMYDTINNSDVSSAEKLIKEYNLLVI